jgi:hypothetical protein
LFAIKQKYKSTCRAAVIGERQQSALSVHSGPQEAVIQFQPKNNKELTSISATLLGSPADSVPGESRLEESRPRELLYIADVENCCIK